MNDDLISRQAAIDVLGVFTQADALGHTPKQIVEALPSAHPRCDEWCTDCKEYDQQKHSCPRWNRVIKQTVEDVRKERTGHWIDDGQYAEGHPHHEWHCSVCGLNVIEVGSPWFKYCPERKAKMEAEK